ncbi:MAG: Tryptophan synthase beta chain, partial [Myxococcaceae bacterium]|nr:Tryptophan synthase beta chain [Myxococcaceae bacterium]
MPPLPDIEEHFPPADGCATHARMESTPPGLPGRFGPYGGRFVAETLMPALDELDAAYREARADAGFEAERLSLLRNYVGRETPLYLAHRLSEAVGTRVWLKREDLCHTGAHKINNTIGQVLLAKRMGKPR